MTPNPYDPATLNFTRQCELERTDPAQASRLKAAASAPPTPAARVTTVFHYAPAYRGAGAAASAADLAGIHMDRAQMFLTAEIAAGRRAPGTIEFSPPKVGNAGNALEPAAPADWRPPGVNYTRLCELAKAGETNPQRPAA